MKIAKGIARYATPIALCLVSATASWSQMGYQFEWPVSVAVDGTGNVYVAEEGRDRVQKFDPTGTLLWRVGRQVQGFTPNVSTYDFSNPSGIAVDPTGQIYVADTGNARVVKLSSQGQWLATWGRRLRPRLDTAQLRRPVAIALDGNNYVYVLDADTGRVHKFSNTGATYLGSWGGALGAGDGQFSILAGCCGPFDIAIISGRNASISAYISDTGNHRIQKWAIGSDAAGNITSSVFVGWMGRCVSGANANCDVANERSRGFQCTSASCSTSSLGEKAGQFANPRGVAVDSAGNLYVADSGNHRIQKFDSAGTHVAMWGSRGDRAREFSTPAGVATDGTTAVHVADYRNGRVVKFTNTGTPLQYSPQRSVLGGGIAVSATGGWPPLLRDSLLDVNPFFIRADRAKTSRIIVRSLALFSGEVALTQSGFVDPSGVTRTMSPNSLTIVSGGSATADLTVSASSSAGSGRFLLPIQARNISLDISRSLSVSFEIIGPVMDDSMAMAPCPVFFAGRGLTPQVLQLKRLLDGLYSQKETREGLPYTMPYTIQIGIGSLTGNRLGWVATFEKPTGVTPPLLLTEAIVAMQNRTTSMVGMYAISSAKCGTAPVAGVGLNPGESGEFRIASTSTTTLVLNLPGQVVAVFAEPNFWRLFSGRKVTFDWLTP